MQDDTSLYGKYADMFNKFFKNPDMASTYKPVILAGLVDIAARKKGGPLDVDDWLSSEGGRVHVDLNLVAVPFAKFYWDMLAGFNPRHMPVCMADDKDPHKDVLNVIKLIDDEIMRRRKEEARREIAPGDKRPKAARGARARGGNAPASISPPTLEHLASDKMAEFREGVIAEAIRKVALNRLADKSMPGLYKVEDGKNSIVLDEGAFEYMKRNSFTLKAALGELIADHLEGTNPAARHIATMVNLNKAYKDKIKKVVKLEQKAMPARDDIGPLLGISLDLTAGLARLAKTKG